MCLHGLRFLSSHHGLPRSQVHTLRRRKRRRVSPRTQDMDGRTDGRLYMYIHTALFVGSHKPIRVRRSSAAAIEAVVTGAASASEIQVRGSLVRSWETVPDSIKARRVSIEKTHYAKSKPVSFVGLGV
jgi:hypothetical protein